MTEAFETTPCNGVSKFPQDARRRMGMFGALASLVLLASPIHGANGAQPTQVRDVDDPGRIPYQSFQNISAGQHELDFPAVPVGHRLVIQHVSGDMNFNFTPIQVVVTVEVTGGATSFFAPFSGTFVKFDQPVQLYVESGEAANVIVLANDGIDPASRGFLTLSGYLLDCTASPCAKIAK